MKSTILFIVVFSFISACNQVDGNKRPESKKTFTDTILKDIPEWYSSSGFTQKMDTKITTLLNLESLQNGFDSLQIRIWIECNNGTSNLIIFEKKNDQWDAVFYSFNIYHNEKYNFEIHDLKTESKIPKSGWDFFSMDLMKTGIIDLPDHSKFSPDYNIPTDGDRVFVEIATSKRYRLYDYPDLGLNSNIIDGPGKLNQALKIIEKEFNYKRPCEDSINYSKQPLPPKAETSPTKISESEKLKKENNLRKHLNFNCYLLFLSSNTNL